jgi:BarA-like signal transduction histidine kinase
MAPIEDENVPHEAEHAAATDAQMRRTSDHAAIADLAAPSAAYVEAEQIAQTNAINAILDVLRDAELIPSA